MCRRSTDLCLTRPDQIRDSKFNPTPNKVLKKKKGPGQSMELSRRVPVPFHIHPFRLMDSCKVRRRTYYRRLQRNEPVSFSVPHETQFSVPSYEIDIILLYVPIYSIYQFPCLHLTPFCKPDFYVKWYEIPLQNH